MDAWLGRSALTTILAIWYHPETVPNIFSHSNHVSSSGRTIGHFMFKEACKHSECLRCLGMSKWSRKFDDNWGFCCHHVWMRTTHYASHEMDVLILVSWFAGRRPEFAFMPNKNGSSPVITFSEGKSTNPRVDIDSRTFIGTVSIDSNPKCIMKEIILTYAFEKMNLFGLLLVLPWRRDTETVINYYPSNFVGVCYGFSPRYWWHESRNMKR